MGGLLYFPDAVEPEIISMPHFRATWWRVMITGYEYDLCTRNSELFWPDQNIHKTKWQQGLINTPDDPYKAERIGRLGEMGFAKVIKRPVWLNEKIASDEYDHIDESGKTYNIKTNAQKRTNHEVFVYVGRNPKAELKHNRFIIGFLEQENKITKTALVVFTGWISSQELSNRPSISFGEGQNRFYSKKTYYYEMNPLEELHFVAHPCVK